MGNSNWKPWLKEHLKRSGIFSWEVIKVVLISSAIILPIRYFLIQPFYVRGASMEPNFYDYEYLIINEIGYRFNPPARGDVVVLHDPYDPGQYFIKRVIGLPGEDVEVKDGSVYIYNEAHKEGLKLDESAYLDASVKTRGNNKLWELGAEEYFVMGDNRTASLDSRIFGPIKKTSIVGRAWLRTWPFTRMANFSTPIYNL